MPRLPTIRVIGSQDISTSFRSWTGASRPGAVTVAMVSLLPLVGAVGRGVVAGRQLAAAVSPPRLLVDRGVGERPELADDLPIDRDHAGGQDAARGLVHEGH